MTTPLSPRLCAVAELVPRGCTVVDIGTDHGQLPVFLVASGRSPRALAVDVADGPLEAARTAVRRAGLDRVEVRRGDGLAGVRPDEAEVVVMAGMGGKLILSILEGARGRDLGRRALVLQPNTDWPAVRRGVVRLGFRIVEEVVMQDRGRHYLVLRAEPGESPALDVLDQELGPVARRTRSPGYLAWLETEQQRLRRAVESAGRACPTELRESLVRIESALTRGQPS